MSDARQPGDFAVCPIAGVGGKVIGTMEGWTGPGFTTWQHALLYVGGGWCLQAEPHGAQIVERPVLGGDVWSTGIIDIPGAARDRVPAEADKWRGVGYSWLDYAALAAHHWHVPDLPVWPQDGHRVTLRDFIADGGHFMCSALVDAFLDRLGVHLFDDGRWEGYVMPWDLGTLIVDAAH